MFHFFVLQFCSSFTVPRALCNSLNHSQINLFLLPKRMFRSGSCATYAQRTQLHTTTHIIWNEYRIIVIACIANSECYSFRCSQPKKVHTGQSSFRRKDKTIFWETFHGYDADFYCAHWIRYFSYCYCLFYSCVFARTIALGGKCYSWQDLSARGCLVVRTIRHTHAYMQYVWIYILYVSHRWSEAEKQLNAQPIYLHFEYIYALRSLQWMFTVWHHPNGRNCSYIRVEGHAPTSWHLNWWDAYLL